MRESSPRLFTAPQPDHDASLATPRPPEPLDLTGWPLIAQLTRTVFPSRRTGTRVVQPLRLDTPRGSIAASGDQ